MESFSPIPRTDISSVLYQNISPANTNKYVPIVINCIGLANLQTLNHIIANATANIQTPSIVVCISNDGQIGNRADNNVERSYKYAFKRGIEGHG